MQIVIGNVLSPDEVETVRAVLDRVQFADGRETAGFAARLVKNNRQAVASDRRVETIRKLVAERILGNEVFALAVRPKALTPIMFSRYEPSMHYGSHVDDALMDGLRTDVSFTLFLSEPASYDGRRAGHRAGFRRGRGEAGGRARWSPIRRPRCTTSPP